jgi:hypothetical protein
MFMIKMNNVNYFFYIDGCERAKKYLPDFGYNDDEIDKICNCIMATQLPQNPKNHLSGLFFI